MTPPVRHALNAAGDFYVEEGCCLACAMPFEVAPDLFAWADGEYQCYVKSQPTTSLELDRMIRSIEVADAGCIRYGGSNRVIQIRLVEMNEGIQCDSLPSDLASRAQELRDKRRMAK